MKNLISRVFLVCAAVCIFILGYGSTADNKTVKSDMTALKAEIQALEKSWADADNARDLKTELAFYADDACSLANDKPMLVGKAAIQKEMQEGFAKKVKGSTVSYEVLDVFGNESLVTEIGKAISKDASGKVTYTGKYMAVWEKRNGKFICIRDIYNNDVKAK